MESEIVQATPSRKGKKIVNILEKQDYKNYCLYILYILISWGKGQYIRVSVWRKTENGRYCRRLLPENNEFIAYKMKDLSKMKDERFIKSF